MSAIYDNWERLVAAVIKRDEIWQLCHADSMSTSIRSESSDFTLSFSSHRDEYQVFDEFTERARFEPSYNFGRRPIMETNFDEILVSANLDGPLQSSSSDTIERVMRYEPGVYVTLRPIILESANLDGPFVYSSRHTFEWVKRYEPGVYVTRVRFSNRIFKPDEAEAWWVRNQHKVYERYCNPLSYYF